MTDAEAAARRRRLVAAWKDEEVTVPDLTRRGFALNELEEVRRELGPKVRATAMPQWGQMRHPKRLTFKKAGLR